MPKTLRSRVTAVAAGVLIAGSAVTVAAPVASAAPVVASPVQATDVADTTTLPGYSLLLAAIMTAINPCAVAPWTC